MEEITKYKALDRNVLAVGKIKYTNKEDDEIFDWAVYIGAVEGKNHIDEYSRVFAIGSKMNIELACLLFPWYPKDKYRE